ncbi:MAG: hypothetical protein MJY51_01310 [Bacteroidales bacterium]|nr:hypothetical protein [Bacteroidales bacterium]
MRKIFTLMAVAMAALVSASCNKEEQKPVEEEKIVKVTNYVIVYGNEDTFKFYDFTLNYKCGSNSQSVPLKIEDMTYNFTGGDSETDIIISLGSKGDYGKYKVIPLDADWTKPYELTVSIDAKVKDTLNFPAPGKYELVTNLTGLYVQGVTNTGFAGEGTIWYPGSQSQNYVIVDLKEGKKQDFYKLLENHLPIIKSQSSKGVRITVSGKKLDGIPAN